MLLTKLDGLGKMAWLAITAPVFATAWPLGVAMLAYLAGSGRLRAWCAGYACARGAWSSIVSSLPSFGPGWRDSALRTAFKGNRTLDDHRSKALSGLEEERREFHAYLERLRKARDKAGFDAFIVEPWQRVAEAHAPGPTAMPA